MVMTPAVVILPMTLTLLLPLACTASNQRLPSGPAVMSMGVILAGQAKRVIEPSLAIFRICPTICSVAQALPSGPAVM